MSLELANNTLTDFLVKLCQRIESVDPSEIAVEDIPKWLNAANEAIKVSIELRDRIAKLDQEIAVLKGELGAAE